MFETAKIAVEMVKGSMHRGDKRYVTLERHPREDHDGRVHHKRSRYAFKRIASER